ncbi:hypothetical protein B9Z55_023064 [Caenorhabditis nigoni]|uniref:Uncharacterized protein n=1 Tax=Caenorhabditis nigoni TaxID=1611254 RepID=A0A2G5SMZ1_9PELO|nr:hypothetical protein B9Z55_023064 [Caenorhabditis nigoni]
MFALPELSKDTVLSMFVLVICFLKYVQVFFVYHQGFFFIRFEINNYDYVVFERIHGYNSVMPHRVQTVDQERALEEVEEELEIMI